MLLVLSGPSPSLTLPFHLLGSPVLAPSPWAPGLPELPANLIFCSLPAAQQPPTPRHTHYSIHAAGALHSPFSPLLIAETQPPSSVQSFDPKVTPRADSPISHFRLCCSSYSFYQVLSNPLGSRCYTGDGPVQAGASVMHGKRRGRWEGSLWAVEGSCPTRGS